MTGSDSGELVMDAEIEGLGAPSRWAGFLRGTALGLVLSVAGALALSLSVPLPEHLPGVGGSAEIERGDALASDSEVTEAEPESTNATVAEASDDSGTEVATSSATPTESAQEEGAVAAPQVTEPEFAEVEPQPDNPVSEVAASETDTEPEADQQDSADQSEQASDDTATAASDGGTETPTTSDSAPQTDTDTDTAADQSSDTLAALAVPQEAEQPQLSDKARELSLAGRAIEINARPFEAPPNAPLLSVVLIDTAGGGVPAEALSLLTMPLTLAIRPDVEGAQSLAESARAANHEVLIELPMARSAEESGPAFLSTTSKPEDLRVGTTNHLAELDQSVGALLPSKALAAKDVAAMKAVLGPLNDHGFALVDLRAGSGSVAGPIATASAMSYAQRNWELAPGASEDDVYQSLETAAFSARQKGTSIVVIPSSPAVLQALLKWGLEKDGRPVWFAPVSAVIERRQDR